MRFVWSWDTFNIFIWYVCLSLRNHLYSYKTLLEDGFQWLIYEYEFRIMLTALTNNKFIDLSAYILEQAV